MPQQLTFDLPSKTALDRDDFFVSTANMAAVSIVDNWDKTVWRTLMVVGPKGSGKTHLCHVWSALSGARHIQARDLTESDVPVLATRAAVVEDIQEIAAIPEAQTALFHLYNMSKAEGGFLMMTANCVPQLMGLTLPDLTSRLHQVGIVNLREPDDALLSAVLMKLFADRQLNPKPDVLPYLARYMDRSFAAAHELVDALDKTALAEGRDVTRKLAGEVLAAMDQLSIWPE
ncbi:chromosomal replication initiator DnaA [Lentibacter algarum]|uniref:DnaA ATPase domain-containing protein n=1 Tax=Lentibacter algarum TaxID=576131 RepID=UPI001C074B83|nr:DnaA/Hda family protein [Lentibacter algarum]MBU2980700.1 chromosomal replication initiator DnaA [Lentibacter algarum]